MKSGVNELPRFLDDPRFDPRDSASGFQ